jgi:hypothetical protein
MTPPLVASRPRRIEHGGDLLGGVNLPTLRLTALSCEWRTIADVENVVLPRREWLDRHDCRPQADLVVFDDRIAAHRFEQAALAAVKRLVRASRR